MSRGVVAPLADVALVTLARSVRVSITSDSESDSFRLSVGGRLGLFDLLAATVSGSADGRLSDRLAGGGAPAADGNHDHWTLSPAGRP